MLERIKSAWAQIKDVVLYVLTPLLAVVFAVYALLSKNRKLRDELTVSQGDAKLKELEGEKKQVDAVAGSAVSDYEKLRNDYLRERDHSLRQSVGGAEGTDSDSGQAIDPGPGCTKQ